MGLPVLHCISGAMMLERETMEGREAAAVCMHAVFPL